MNKLKKIQAVITAALFIFTAVSCSKSKNKDSETEPVTEQLTTEEATEEGFTPAEANEAMTITWLGDYDLNPAEGKERSTALALFEDVYGGKINYVPVYAKDRYTRLSEMVLSGEEVDMFQYETETMPYYVKQDLFEPLDAYYEQLGMNEGLWDNMQDTIEMFAYNGGHYVIPYSIDEPFLITYSRKMMQEENLDDPYELYKSGEWNWDKFVSMMEQFVGNAPMGTYRYGINGDFGKEALISTGHTIVNNENGLLVNNIDDEKIADAEALLQEIAQKGLYRINWIGHFPSDGTILFFAMGDWALKESNALNKDKDLMAVPFPKPEGNDKYYISCDYNARMLVKNSAKGEAVATYLKCERLAAEEPGCKEAAKAAALAEGSADSKFEDSYLTEEQYDVIQEYLSSESVCPIFDFAYGMGGGMYGVDSRNNGAAVNVLTTAFLNGTPYGSWEELRDAYKDRIISETEKFNQ